MVSHRHRVSLVLDLLDLPKKILIKDLIESIGDLEHAPSSCSFRYVDHRRVSIEITSEEHKRLHYVEAVLICY